MQHDAQKWLFCFVFVFKFIFLNLNTCKNEEYILCHMSEICFLNISMKRIKSTSVYSLQHYFKATNTGVRNNLPLQTTIDT